MSSLKFREILEDHRNLLEKNLILNDDFFRVLVTHSVFSESLCNDIKNNSTSERGQKLVDLLLTRTESGFKKFCDVLEVTGHRFLSDCLRDAEMIMRAGYSNTNSDIDSMLKELPQISKHVKTEQQKNSLQTYLNEKIQKEVVKRTWKGDISVKEKLILARQNQITEHWHYEEEQKIRDRSYQELLVECMKIKEFSDGLRREVKSLHQHIQDMERKHKDDLVAQINFNMANDSQLTQLNEAAEDASGILAKMNAQLQELMGDNYNTVLTKTMYENLESNFLNFLNMNQSMTILYEKFGTERQYLSNQVAGEVIPESADLNDYFREYLTQLESHIEGLTSRLEKIQSEINHKSRHVEKLKWLEKNMDSTLDATHHSSTEYLLLVREREDNLLSIQHKDDQILELKKTNKRLHERILELEECIARSNEKTSHYNDAVQIAESERAVRELEEKSKSVEENTEDERLEPNKPAKQFKKPAETTDSIASQGKINQQLAFLVDEPLKKFPPKRREVRKPKISSTKTTNSSFIDEGNKPVLSLFPNDLVPQDRTPDNLPQRADKSTERADNSTERADNLTQQDDSKKKPNRTKKSTSKSEDTQIVNRQVMEDYCDLVGGNCRACSGRELV